MLKKSKVKKKILAIVLLFLTLFTVIQPVILAANQTISGSGSDTFMARQYATRVRTTDSSNNSENGIIARRLIKRSENWNFGNGDGILVFCAQNGVPYETGTNYNGNYYEPTSSELRTAAKVAYIGWYKDMGTYRFRW